MEKSWLKISNMTHVASFFYIYVKFTTQLEEVIRNTGITHFIHMGMPRYCSLWECENEFPLHLKTVALNKHTLEKLWHANIAFENLKTRQKQITIHTMLFKVGLQPGYQVCFITLGFQSPGCTLLLQLSQLHENNNDGEYNQSSTRMLLNSLWYTIIPV